MLTEDEDDVYFDDSMSSVRFAPTIQPGRLLFYRDITRDGSGDVANPSVIDRGGWNTMEFICSGGDGIIYAVDAGGQVLFYRDRTRDGTGDVSNPSVIGQGGWQSMRHLSSADDGIIYAVDHSGRLLFYRDTTRGVRVVEVDRPNRQERCRAGGQVRTNVIFRAPFVHS